MYRLYARWGQKINRGIWQAFGDANSVATEVPSLSASAGGTESCEAAVQAVQ